jgi:hypothetical protein
LKIRFQISQRTSDHVWFAQLPARVCGERRHDPPELMNMNHVESGQVRLQPAAQCDPPRDETARTGVDRMNGLDRKSWSVSLPIPQMIRQRFAVTAQDVCLYSHRALRDGQSGDHARRPALVRRDRLDHVQHAPHPLTSKPGASE